MKGIIFTSLNDFIETQFGLAYWDSLIERSQPASQGIYTASGSYPDSEILAYIQLIHKDKNLPVETILDIFGSFLFDELYAFHKTIMTTFATFNEFILSINDVIHFEVKKLWENTTLPTLKATLLNENEIEIFYQSQRKLCFLAIGLIKGAAKHYQVDIEIAHPVCVYNHADHCIINIKRLC